MLKPGGRCVILEITQPQKPPLSTFFGIWFDRIVPVIGPHRGRPGGLLVPARVRARLPAARRAGPPDGRGRARAGIRYTVLAGRDHRHPLGRATRLTERRAVNRSDSSAARHPGDGRGRGLAAGASWPPSSSGSASWSRDTARSSGATRARRSRPAASACGRCSCSSAPGPRPRRRRHARRRGDRARPHGDARPRRRPGPGAASPRPAHRRRHIGPRARHRGRRPPALARLR